jgi:prolipoprotein diacylglyceryl transferase
MRPVLFEIGGVPIYSHGFFVFLGFVVGLLMLTYEARRRSWPKEELVPITMGAIVGGAIGARVSMIFFHGWEVAPLVLDFFRLFDPRIGPGSILGAIAGAYIGGYLTAKVIGKKGCACDAFAPAMAIAMSVGRIGDFLAAEDGLGKVTDLPWGVPVPGVDYLVHPTPLYDSAFNLLWFGVLVALRNHPKMQDGNLFKFGLFGYALFRFFVEFVRNNRVLAFGLTGQQYFCLALLALIVLYAFRKWGEAARLQSV